MRKLILSFLFSVFGVALFIAPVFATGSTCTVASSGADYTTIQAAVNDINCTTIDVASGSYVGANINRSLVLDGPNATIPGNGTRSPEADITSTLNITASDVTVAGFSFSGSGVQVNILGGTSALSGVSVTNNIFGGYGTVGFVTDKAGNLSVTGNKFTGPATSGEAMQIKSDGLQGGCDGTTVNDNVFNASSNNGGAEINFSCTGSNSSNVTVSGNTSTGLTGGTSFTAFSGVIDRIVVKDNNVTGNSNSGSLVFFWGDVSGTAEVTGNTLVDSAGSGVSIHGNTDITPNVPSAANIGTFTITQNNLSGDATGVYVSSVALGSGARVNVNRNNLSGDATDGVDNEYSSLTADGTCNWWGDASGPSSVGSGSGSHVTLNVNYTPWLVSSDLNGTCGGLVTVTIDKYLNGVQATSILTRGASYPMASSWNATNIGVGSGFYSLSPTGFNNTNPYEATTSKMTSGASYSTNEVTGGTSNVLPIDAQCQSGKTRLVGYSTGDSLDQAASTTPDPKSPSFPNITSNQYVVVWNESCIAPTTMNDCKNGGWVKFNTPTFKNQGDCVSYVQSNPHAIGNKSK